MRYTENLKNVIIIPRLKKIFIIFKKFSYYSAAYKILMLSPITWQIKYGGYFLS